MKIETAYKNCRYKKFDNSNNSSIEDAKTKRAKSVSDIKQAISKMTLQQSEYYENN